MSNIKPIHHGPMLPLAIMALFALMIPIVTVANSSQKTQEANAKMRIPGNTPTPVRWDGTYMAPTNVPTASPSLRPTTQPSMKYTY